MTEPVHPVRVRSIRWEATDVFSFILNAIDDTPLPPFEPGSHIDLQLPIGLMRSYSLSNDGSDGDYRITVARDADSTGGSAFLAEQLRPGAAIAIGAPRNNFPLYEQAPLSVFIAGGIGVTPFVSMAMRLNMLGRRWRLHYCVRTQDRAALLKELEALTLAGSGEIVMNFDQEPGGVMLDLTTVVSSLGPQDHVYCCGPIGMLEAFRKTCEEKTIPDERVHFEYFKSNVQNASEGGYELVLAKSGKTVRVKEGKTILETLLALGLDVPFSCEEGVCGACETRVLAGEPDHRDLILSAEERKSNRTMMICCSGTKSASLTLDI
ncbi:PDR/VanB family oxidoreductase [Sphingobium sp.]|uniref:PDR/VanB family oxidoreductase n=1 Tax=Sphingobium sp. TaxID=1912891 RepID=UPI0028BD4F6F|nr:PDR/VanB family oxidoreductase [Sphingobium sp.]